MSCQINARRLAKCTASPSLFDSDDTENSPPAKATKPKFSSYAYTRTAAKIQGEHQTVLDKKPLIFETKPEDADALKAYAAWMKLEGVEVSFLEPFNMPSFTNFLSGRATAIAYTDEHRSWPILVHYHDQQPDTPITNFDQIAQTNPDFVVQRSYALKGEWQVKKGTKIWYELQNILRCNAYDEMQLVIFDKTSGEVLGVECCFERETYIQEFKKVSEYVLCSRYIQDPKFFESF